MDKMKNGSCPICHRYFMIFYILREHGLIDLVVTTFMPENPPKEVSRTHTSHTRTHTYFMPENPPKEVSRTHSSHTRTLHTHTHTLASCPRTRPRR